MELDVSKLIIILDKQNSLIEELRDLANEQLQALKQDDVDKIFLITGQQDYTMREMAVLENERVIIMNELSSKTGVEIKNFSELFPFIGSDDSQTIQEIRDKILNSSQKIKTENELNTLLIKQSLKYTKKILGILNVNNGSFYGKSGDLQRRNSKGILDINI